MKETFRATVHMSKEDHRILLDLVSKLGESQSSVMRRALNEMYYKKQTEEKNQ